jgi:hypothetical protein
LEITSQQLAPSHLRAERVRLFGHAQQCDDIYVVKVRQEHARQARIATTFEASVAVGHIWLLTQITRCLPYSPAKERPLRKIHDWMPEHQWLKLSKTKLTA